MALVVRRAGREVLEPKNQADFQKQEAAENKFQPVHSEIVPESARPRQGQHKFSARVPGKYLVG